MRTQQPFACLGWHLLLCLHSLATQKSTILVNPHPPYIVS